MENVKSITPNEPANFTPELGNYKELKPFRYWCQKVLPLVYDDTLSYYELLCKVVDYLNKTMEDVETLNGDVTNLLTAYKQLQNYVNTYFSSLDVQEEINNKLDNMAESGELYEIIRRYTDPIVNEQNEKINVLKARMDTFASLPEGSTSGDAELTDIRVGYNGKVYPSAGDAVREQVSGLNLDLYYLQTTNLFYKEYIEHDWYWNSSDGSHNYEVGWANSNFIPVSDLLEIDFANKFMYSFFTINKTFISGTFLYENTEKINKINVPQNAFYVVVSWSKNDGYPNAIKTNAKDTIIVSKDGNGDYDSILKASLKAYKKGSKVIVEKGDYDILQEFKDVFGDDFFTNYTQESITGIILRNNIIYQFSPLANVYFEYSDSNGNVLDIFSPFNSGKWGFTLDGLNIKTKNAKYCVHDERGDNSGTEPYINNYINCIMYLDNRENTRIATTQCIGGGLGTNGKIYIDGCVFDTENHPNSTYEYIPTVSYHNDWRSGSKSLIEIKNCYLKRGTIRFGYYGESTKITDCIISNCSLESNIVLTAESSSYSNINMDIIEWNNVIRN